MTNDENMAIRPLVEPEVVPGRDGVGRDVVDFGNLDLSVDVLSEEKIHTRQELIQQARIQLLFARLDRKEGSPRGDYRKHMAFARKYRIEAAKAEKEEEVR